MHEEIKEGRGERRRVVVVGECGVGEECDTEGGGVHFSSTASHPVRVSVEDLKKNLGFAPQQTARRGMFLGRLNLDPARCTINPD